MGPNCLVIAGEKSGEEHCLSFFDSLQASYPEMSFWGVGGDDLRDRGMELLYHLKDFSSMGFSEVIFKVPFYLKALKRIENEVKKRQCKVAILIDFQDFNLKLSKKLKSLGVKVLYYVAPQAWAWKEWRAKTIQETTDTLFTILPFEKKWFQDRGVKNVISLKHPLWLSYKDKISKEKSKVEVHSSANWKRNPKTILLLPGSRNSEVGPLLPVFVRAIECLSSKWEIDLRIVSSENVDDSYYKPFLHLFNHVYESKFLGDALSEADLAVAASGTVTLAAALFSVPTVVCYKLSLLNNFIFNNFLNYDGPISLANIVHGDLVFPELFNEGFSDFNIAQAVENWLEDYEKFSTLKDRLRGTEALLRGEMEDVAPYLEGLLRESYVNNG